MADRAGPIGPGNGGVVERPKLTSWLFGTRAGLLTLWAILAAVLLAAPVV